MADKMVKTPLRELIDEHEKLVPILREGSKPVRKAEANDQARELKGYRAMKRSGQRGNRTNARR